MMDTSFPQAMQVLTNKRAPGPAIIPDCTVGTVAKQGKRLRDAMLERFCERYAFTNTLSEQIRETSFVAASSMPQQMPMTQAALLSDFTLIIHRLDQEELCRSGK